MIIIIKRSKMYDKININTAAARNQRKQKRDNYSGFLCSTF